MNLIQKIIFALVLIATAVVAVYVFVWALLFLAIAVPVAILYWRRRLKKWRKQGQARDDNVIIVRQSKNWR